MSKNGWFSTAQAPNPRLLADVTNALQAINNKLDMILDALTKPAEKSEAKSTIDLFRAYDADTMQPVEFKPEEPRLTKPAALDVDDEFCSMKMPKGTEEEPKRKSGKPARQQIDEWIVRQFETLPYFRRAAQLKVVKAKIEAKSSKANSTHRYTHRVVITNALSPAFFAPTVFSKAELDEVVAYLESLGVKVNTNALNRV